jgi:hypothetical protein
MTAVLVLALLVLVLVAIGGWRHAYQANARLRVLTLREVLQIWEEYEDEDALYRWLTTEIAAADRRRAS